MRRSIPARCSFRSSRLSERDASVDQVIARLRPKLAQVPGGRLYLAAVQDIRAGGRQSNAQYQYTLQSDNVNELYTWTPKLVEALEQHNPVLTDVSSDQQQSGLETYLDIDRDTTARLGISPLQIDNTLYDAFGQRQVSVIYSAINQYHVVMEIDPRYTQYPNSLRDVYVATSGATPAGTATIERAGGHGRGAGSKARKLRHGRERRHGRDTGAAVKTAATTKTAAPSANVNAARNAATNALANTGQGATSAGAAVSTDAGDHDPARRRQPLPAEPHAAVRQSPGIVRRLDDLVQSAAGQIARRGGGRDQRRDRPHPYAEHDPRHAHRHGAALSAVAQQRADPDPRGDRRRLHPARHALRELHPPDHHPVDAAVRRRRRAAGADAVPHRVRHHRADRRDPADRHRQEERDHDDRFRHRGEARRGI